jgi:hypothetical protein
MRRSQHRDTQRHIDAGTAAAGFMGGSSRRAI